MQRIAMHIHPSTSPILPYHPALHPHIHPSVSFSSNLQPRGYPHVPTTHAHAPPTRSRGTPHHAPSTHGPKHPPAHPPTNVQIDPHARDSSSPRSFFFFSFHAPRGGGFRRFASLDLVRVRGTARGGV